MKELTKSFSANELTGDIDSEGNDDDPVNIIVKVSSKAMHGTLIDSMASTNAMNTIRSIIWSHGVLLAFKLTAIGVVTVMRDLRGTYSDVRPATFILGVADTVLPKHKLGPLWSAWEELVKSVLLPAAVKGVAFLDLRFVYDVTSNVLWRQDDETCKIDLKVIDYESFGILANWLGPPDGRYVNKYVDATSFLFVQIMSLGLSWRNAIKADDVPVTGICSDLKDVGFLVSTTTLDMAVLRLLDYFGTEFDVTRQMPAYEMGMLSEMVGCYNGQQKLVREEGASGGDLWPHWTRGVRRSVI